MPFDQQRIEDFATNSAVAQYRWKDRGRAPIGYLRGIAVTFALALEDLKAGDAAVMAIAAPATGDADHDVLDWYADELHAAELAVGTDRKRLLAVFAVLLGLGMRESSGRHCEGRDISADNTTADTAEAGLFQVSFNSMKAAPTLRPLYELHRSRQDLLTVFDDGVQCSVRSWKNWGEGEGRDFQAATKSNPRFATTYAGVLLRRSRKHWGPINRKRAEVTADAVALLRAVEAEVH